MIHDFCIKNKNHLQILLVIFFFAWGMYWRTSNWQGYSLGFDQVQILRQAEKITKGQLTLIGPRTGPASTFTGPLIYYLTAIIQFLSSPVISVVVTPLLLAFITGMCLFWLSKHYVNFKASILVLAIWATAPLLLQLDRIFWNPNLSLLSFSLVFWPILLAKESNRLDLWLVFIGAFLSYQAHFSAFVLIPIALVLTIFFKLDKKFLLTIFLGITTSLLPTFLFDLRHDWLNFKGIVNFSTKQGQQINLQLIFHDCFNNLAIIFETFSKLFYHFSNFKTRVVFGTVFFTIVLIFLLKNTKQLVWRSSIILFLISFFFAFYRGEKPEYYFLLVVPIFIINLSKLSFKVPIHVLAIFFLSQVIVSYQFMVEKNRTNLDLSLGNCLEVEKIIKNITNTTGIKYLVYDIIYPNDVGIKYLLEPTYLTENGVIVHISYPISDEFENIQSIGRTAVIIEEKYE